MKVKISEKYDNNFKKVNATTERFPLFHIVDGEPCILKDDIYYRIEEPFQQIYEVFDVTHKNGYPHFTIFKDGEWITKSAKYFMPV